MGLNISNVLLLCVYVILGIVVTAKVATGSGDWQCPENFPLKQKVNFFDQGPLTVSLSTDDDPLRVLNGSDVKLKHKGSVKITLTSKTTFYAESLAIIVHRVKSVMITVKSSTGDNITKTISDHKLHVVSQTLGDEGIAIEIQLDGKYPDKRIRCKNLELNLCLAKRTEFQYPLYKDDVCPDDFPNQKLLDYEHRTAFGAKTIPKLRKKSNIFLGSNKEVETEEGIEIKITAKRPFLPLKVSVSVQNGFAVKVKYMISSTNVKMHKIEIFEPDWITINSAFNQEVTKISIYLSPGDSKTIKFKDIQVIGCFSVKEIPITTLAATTQNITKNPKTSETAETPKASKTTKTPKSPEITKTPKVPQPTKTPKASESTKTLKVSKPTETPKVPQPTKTPKASESTKTTKISKPTKTPKASKPTKTPKASESTNTPTASTETPKTLSKSPKTEIPIRATNVNIDISTTAITNALPDFTHRTDNFEISGKDGSTQSKVSPEKQKCLCDKMSELVNLYRTKDDIIEKLNANKVIRNLPVGEYRNFLYMSLDIYCKSDPRDPSRMLQEFIIQDSSFRVHLELEASELKIYNTKETITAETKSLLTTYFKEFYDKIKVCFKNIKKCLEIN